MRRDALENWAIFQRWEKELLVWIQVYKQNNGCPDDAGKRRNPQGTLGGLAWDCIVANATGPLRRDLVDFDKMNDRALLRRGMISFLKCLAQEVERGENAAPEVGSGKAEV